MPRVVDYPELIADLDRKGLQCLYFNSGAFGFNPALSTESAGWLIRDDATLRPSARQLARLVSPRSAVQLSHSARMLWEQGLAGQHALVMPKSNWAYEFNFGSADWLADAMAQAGADAALLKSRHDGAAVEFSLAERDAFEPLVATLLERLAGSDFQIIFSAYTTVCTVHHHKQLWWTTRDPGLAGQIRSVGEPL